MSDSTTWQNLWESTLPDNFWKTNSNSNIIGTKANTDLYDVEMHFEPEGWVTDSTINEYSYHTNKDTAIRHPGAIKPIRWRKKLISQTLMFVESMHNTDFDRAMNYIPIEFDRDLSSIDNLTNALNNIRQLTIKTNTTLFTVYPDNVWYMQIKWNQNMFQMHGRGNKHSVPIDLIPVVNKFISAGLNKPSQNVTQPHSEA